MIKLHVIRFFLWLSCCGVFTAKRWWYLLAVLSRYGVSFCI